MLQVLEAKSSSFGRRFLVQLCMLTSDFHELLLLGFPCVSFPWLPDMLAAVHGHVSSFCFHFGL